MYVYIATDERSKHRAIEIRPKNTTTSIMESSLISGVLNDRKVPNNVSSGVVFSSGLATFTNLFSFLWYVEVFLAFASFYEILGNRFADISRDAWWWSSL